MKINNYANIDCEASTVSMEKVTEIATELRLKILESESFEEAVDIVGDYYAFNTNTSPLLNQWFSIVEEAVEKEFQKDKMNVSRINSPQGLFYCVVDKNGVPRRRLFVPWSDFKEFKTLIEGIDDELHILYFLKALDRKFHPFYFIRLLLMGEFCFMSLSTTSTIID